MFKEVRYMFDEETREKNSVMNDNGLKNVFMIGDSIRIGYCRQVKENLKSIANVIYPDENCRNTQYTYVTLSNWIRLVANPLKVDAVYWNNGHWDISHWAHDEEPLNTVKQYCNMLLRIHKRLKNTFKNAKIIFATTTPMNPDGSMGENVRTTKEIKKYNLAAIRTLEDKGVMIDNLFEFAKGFSSEYYADYCHYTVEGFKIIADHISEYLKGVL